MFNLFNLIQWMIENPMASFEFVNWHDLFDKLHVYVSYLFKLLNKNKITRIHAKLLVIVTEIYRDIFSKA